MPTSCLAGADRHAYLEWFWWERNRKIQNHPRAAESKLTGAPDGTVAQPAVILQDAELWLLRRNSSPCPGVDSLSRAVRMGSPLTPGFRGKRTRSFSHFFDLHPGDGKEVTTVSENSLN